MTEKNRFIDWLKERQHKLPIRLLFVTVLFIILAEIVIFLPSVAQFRHDYLQERIERAYLISVSFEVAPDNMIESETVRRLFSTADIIGVRKDAGLSSTLILSPETDLDTGLDRTEIVLDEGGWMQMVAAAIGDMSSSENMYLQVRGHPRSAPDTSVDIILERAPLRSALWQFAYGILGLSLFICVIVAGAVYLALLFLFVRPMVKLTANMKRFRGNPDDENAMMVPSSRRDEIGQAERVLAEMQFELRNALRQQSRLATLGEGMSKVNHDLRNVLASAVLMSDRLSRIEDPQVKRLTPRLIAALDKAVVMCQATLDFGRAEVAERENVNLFDLVEEVSDELKIFTEGDNPVRFFNGVSPDLEAYADRTQLFRALFNLARNAAEALSGSLRNRPQVVFCARMEGGMVVIEVHDNGPGIPEPAQENLFVPFRGSVRRGGSGLGLAIAAETVRAHGGEISLLETGPEGTVFRISIPQRA